MTSPVPGPPEFFWNPSLYSLSSLLFFFVGSAFGSSLQPLSLCLHIFPALSRSPFFLYLFSVKCSFPPRPVLPSSNVVFLVTWSSFLSVLVSIQGLIPTSFGTFCPISSLPMTFPLSRCETHFLLNGPFFPFLYPCLWLAGSPDGSVRMIYDVGKQGAPCQVRQITPHSASYGFLAAFYFSPSYPLAPSPSPTPD